MKEATPTKKLGLWMSTSLVVGNMIGAGIFLMPSALAGYGGISILGWLFSAAGGFLLAKVFSNLSVMVPDKTGGPYVYSKKGLGDFAAFLVAWGYWISIWLANAAITIAFVGAIAVFFPIFSENKVFAVGLGLCTIWGLTWINSLGIHESGKVQLLTTILKLIPLVLIILGGFFYFDSSNFTPFNVSGKSSFEAISITAALTLYAFMGIESATIPSENIENPSKTIPRATLLGTLITTLVYILGTVSVMGMIPLEQLANSAAPFSDAMEIMSGEWGRNLVAIGVAIAAFGALNGWILVQGQISMATARDGLFPKIFEKKNSKDVPMWGIVIGSLLTSAMLLMNYTEGLVDQFKFLILLTAFCVLIPYLFSAASYMLIRLREGTKSSSFVSVIVLGGLAFLYSAWAIYGAGKEAVIWGAVLLLFGLPLYAWQKYKNK